jgi:hypothetical protein
VNYKQTGKSVGFFGGNELREAANGDPLDIKESYSPASCSPAPQEELCLMMYATT